MYMKATHFEEQIQFMGPAGLSAAVTAAAPQDCANIVRKSEPNPINSWSFTEADQERYRPGQLKEAELNPEGHLTSDDVKAMHAEIGVLRNEIAALKNERARTQSAR
jgi:hypothetical protein